MRSLCRVSESRRGRGGIESPCQRTISDIRLSKKRILGCDRIPDVMKTIAIDFETANPKPGNACQIGLAWIVGGRVTRVEERYIRPRDNWFAFTWVHGITADHVREAPEFPDVLAEFRDELDGALVLAPQCRVRCRRDAGLRPRLSGQTTQDALPLHARYRQAG